MKANEKQAVNAVTGLFTEVLNVVQIKVGQHKKKKNQFIQVVSDASSFSPGLKKSKEVVSHRSLRRDSSGFLRCSFKYDKFLLEMLIKLQNGCYITTPRKYSKRVN